MLPVTTVTMGWFGSGESDKQEDDAPEIEDLSKKEIRKQIIKEEQNLDKVSEDLENRRNRYRKHLQEGAQAPEQTRRVHAIKARLEKFKSKVQTLERNKTVKNLTMWELARGYKEIQSLLNEVEAEISPEEVLDFDTTKLQDDVNEMNADLQAEMHEIEAMMQSFETSNHSASMGTTSEEELMDRIAAGEVDVDDLDVGGQDVVTDESDSDTTTSDIDIEGDVGLDDVGLNDELPDEWSDEDDENQW